ncbi:MAG: SUMF1/EgtB/PvdO family nonheme iron enzyme [Pseudomonadota bacterium]|nr:SUMF1/EgtB/PvdO family nonheme iron enzyme [Pseudomonadota bacterium]
MSARLELKIFLSSPGDVSDERGLARRVLDRLSQEYSLRDRVHLEAVSWDDLGAPVPLDAHLTPQEAINNRRPKPSQCEVVVVILWSRMGTPLPPEHRKPDGTPYVSGTEWEFCDALEAAEKTGKPTVLVYRRSEKRQVDLDDAQLEEKRRQYKGVEAFFAQFTNTDGSLRQSVKPYASPSEFADKLERELRELIQVQLDALPRDAPPPAKGSSAATRDPTTKPIWEGNPYLGLNAFRERHAAIFFGRGRESDELVKRFAAATTRIVAVIGASGSGKSSLVGAGLIPRLRDGALSGSGNWVSVRFTPAERGRDPFVNLTRKLAAQLPSASESPEALSDRLRTRPAEINALAGQVLQGKSANAELLLFADQFEELFSARVEERHREPFIELIDAIASSPRIRVVLTLRADYYEHCTRDPRLAALLRDGSFPLAAPTPLALAEMIERPARVAGLDPEPGLAGAILKDAGTEPGALALVEFALEELYERSGGKQLTVAAYRMLGAKNGDGGKVGGIGGVIEGQAEKAVQDAAGNVDEAALAKIFRQLADVDEKGGTVRTRARLDAFADREQALLNRLVDGRLLVTNKDDANVSWVEVAHEAVLRHWRRFSHWLEDNRAFLLWRKRLTVMRGSRTLLQGEALAEALGQIKQHAQHLDSDDLGFIENSRRSARNRRWGGQVAVALVLVVATGAAVWWYQEEQRRRPILHEEDWVVIPSGKFQMGSSDANIEAKEAGVAERPQDTVSIAKPFKLSRYEVTFEEYDRFAYATDRRPPSDAGFGAGFTDAERARLPVINVSWEDATAYAGWLSEKTGTRFRLPTEAEWEYAARAGTTERRYWGEDPAQACVYANVFDRKHGTELQRRFGVSWESHACDDDYATLAPVGRFKPNRFGLYDMLGNVYEWVQDCNRDSHAGASLDGGAWEEGFCALRVIRGGSWADPPKIVRSATRSGGPPDHRSDTVGFRLAHDLD